MTTKVAPFKHKWAFALLWTNVAVVLVELIVFVGNPTRPMRDLLQSLAFTFVYANLTSFLAVVILGWLWTKPRLARCRRGRLRFRASWCSPLAAACWRNCSWRQPASRIGSVSGSTTI